MFPTLYLHAILSKSELHNLLVRQDYDLVNMEYKSNPSFSLVNCDQHQLFSFDHAERYNELLVADLSSG